MVLWAYLSVFILLSVTSGFIECDTLDGFEFSWKAFFKGCAIGSVGSFLITGILAWMYNGSI